MQVRVVGRIHDDEGPGADFHDRRVVHDIGRISHLGILWVNEERGGAQWCTWCPVGAVCSQTRIPKLDSSRWRSTWNEAASRARLLVDQIGKLFRPYGDALPARVPATPDLPPAVPQMALPARGGSPAKRFNRSAFNGGTNNRS
jgi:hypothetical protein